MEENATPEVKTEIFNVTIEGKDTVIVYDYENMSVDQCFDAETKWMLFNKLFTMLPTTPDEYQKAVLRISKAEAMASLLTIKDGDKYEYQPSMNREALRLIKTADKGRLEKAKENFLTLTDIISVESVMQYADTIKLASITEDYRSQVMKELKSVVNEYLGEMQLENIIQMATGQKNTGPSAIGKSSGSSQKMTPKNGKKS